MPFTDDAESGFALLLPYRKWASWTEWTDNRRQGIPNVAPQALESTNACSVGLHESLLESIW
jgi:hypothetical protein